MDGSVSLGSKAIGVESIWPLHRELRGVFFVCMDSCIFKLCRMNLLCLLFGLVMNGGRKIRCGRANVVRFLKNKRIKTPKQTTMWSKIFREFLKICYERDVRGYNSLGTITKNLYLLWGRIYQSCLWELLFKVSKDISEAITMVCLCLTTRNSTKYKYFVILYYAQYLY